jgi:hypothetical protein
MVLLLAIATAVLGVAAVRWSPPLGRSGALSASPSHAGCADYAQVRLFFGLQTPGGQVSPGEWSDFLTGVITPRFPSGLTVMRADGQWRAPGSDVVVREASQVVEILVNEAPDVEQRIQDVARLYRKRFRQESVLITRDRVEACF